MLGGSYVAVTGGPLGRGQDVPNYVTVPVSQGTLQVTVTATGPVTNPRSIPLSFKSSGKLAELGVVVGQSVKAGQMLAQLDTADLQAQLLQAQATLDAQMASEAKTLAGATPEQQTLANARVAGTHTVLDGSQQSLSAAEASADAAGAHGERTRSLAGGEEQSR